MLAPGRLTQQAMTQPLPSSCRQSVEMRLWWPELAIEWKVREEESCARIRTSVTGRDGEVCAPGGAGMGKQGPGSAGQGGVEIHIFSKQSLSTCQVLC